MTKIIKNFSEFKKVDEGAMDFFSGLLGSGKSAFTDVIKGKVSDYLLSFFGVNPDSLFGTIIRNFSETVDVSDLYDFIVKGKGGISVKTLAPKLTDVTMETLSEMGVDGIASRFKIEDKNGWIYRTMKEMISNQSKQADFRENILNFWTMILTSIAGGKTKPPFSPSKARKNPFGLTSSEREKISSDPTIKQSAQKLGMTVPEILKSMTNGGTNPSGAMGTVGGQ
jgi:hypothetical protein